MWWHSRYGVPKTWVSDNATHFKNQVLALLSKFMKAKQEFVVAYSPWLNGSVERVNRDVLQVHLIPLVQAKLNQSPVPSLAGRAPIEVFTGLPCPSPISTIFVPDQRERRTLLNKKRAEGYQMVNFSIGDYVLRSRVDEKNQNKLLVTWVGPYVVTKCNAHSFTVKHLVTGRESNVHASRLKFFAECDLEVTEELREHIAAQGIVLKVEAIHQHRWNEDMHDYQLAISWEGLEAIEDSWEPLKVMHQDVKVLVDAYVDRAKDEKLTTYYNLLKA
ncbi:hypothetical protein PHYSODRAFT_510353 [Phytophthora sojae]|uniref:Integrase catalytic domain-containing protein n=1 Tax=Phytophthora sojae (strain P6497) TaxID=1094619 RepID=G4ZRT7_PHYSP|nr:hypothetical protein PHYSODRAFT_510353 [Phytophthora sojae]EGZ13974.1 hypothetical protein PHYSODRAFT_510353 [Phytophthora sojae]|eukprot:XP_009531403.1 hypothetical protein PHYSODRAFT_510353 [Phytophthora sojae]